MTVAEMIKVLKRYDPTDLLVIENDQGDYLPLTDRLGRVRIGVGDEEHHCVAIGNDDCWPTEGGGILYALPEED